LIALAMIDQLAVLQHLYHEVLVPNTVPQEVLQGGAANLGVRAYQHAEWIQVRELATPFELALLASLDVGEASVIQLARECDIPLVLIDERKGRKVARSVYHLRVIGTAGLLVKAKHQGLITNVREALTGMRNGGYHLHERIVEFALREAGEW
jgi:predicted nucleic acid-binding protein